MRQKQLVQTKATNKLYKVNQVSKHAPDISYSMSHFDTFGAFLDRLV